MALFASLLAKLGFETSGWTQGTTKAKKEIKSLNEETHELFHSMNENFGKHSAIGQFGHLLAGGGVIGGISLAAKEIEKLTDEAVKANEAFSAGTISQSEYIEKIGSAIPVVGSFFAASYKLTREITGQAEAERKATAELEHRIKVMDSAVKYQEKLEKETKSLAASMKESAAEAKENTKLANITDDTEKELTKITDDGAKKIEDMHKKVTEAIHQDVIDGLQKQMDALVYGHHQTTKADTDRMDSIRLELNRLAKDKETLLKQEQETTEAYAEETAAKVSEIKKKADEKDQEEQAKAIEESTKMILEQVKEQAKAEAEAKKEALEKDKDETEKHIDKLKEDVNRPLVSTEAVRGSLTVLTNPKSEDVAELKTANDHLAEIKQQLKDLNTKSATVTQVTF